MDRGVKAVLFDLDETLVLERPTAEKLIGSICSEIEERRGLSPDALGESVFAEARKLWFTHDLHPFCKQIGVSSWEGLWGRFEGDSDELAALRAWTPVYRTQTWANALALHGCNDDSLAGQLAEQYYEERAHVHIKFPEVCDVLDALKGRYRLGIITNGASDMQRTKLAGAGLDAWFDAVVAAGDVLSRKPNRAPFERALSLLEASPNTSVMIGDSLEGDIQGAQQMGICAVWLNRLGRANETDITPDHELESLTDLLTILGLD